MFYFCKTPRVFYLANPRTVRLVVGCSYVQISLMGTEFKNIFIAMQTYSKEPNLVPRDCKEPIKVNTTEKKIKKALCLRRFRLAFV